MQHGQAHLELQIPHLDQAVRAARHCKAAVGALDLAIVPLQHCSDLTSGQVPHSQPFIHTVNRQAAISGDEWRAKVVESNVCRRALQLLLVCGLPLDKIANPDTDPMILRKDSDDGAVR